MRTAAQLVRVQEDGLIGSVLPEASCYRTSSESGLSFKTLTDGALSPRFWSGSMAYDPVRDNDVENSANDFLPVLPGTEHLASSVDGWLTWAFHCDAGRAPRVQLIPAESIAAAGRLVPRGVPACAVPQAAVSAGSWSGACCEARDRRLEAGIYFLTPHLEDLCRTFVQLSDANVSNRAYRIVRLYELVCETIDAFLRNELMAADGDVRLAAVERAQLNCARRHIVKHYADKLTIGQIARAAGIGRAKLIRGFRELYGCTVHEMITTTRLKVAAAALRRTRRPISRIAFESGYHSSAAFTRAFAKCYGSSPSAFRAEG